MGGGQPMKIKHCLNDIRAKLYINQFLASVADIIN